MKNLIYFLLTLVLWGIAGCSNENDIFSSSEKQQDATTEKLQAVAQLISTIVNDKESLGDVKSLIDLNLSYGFDEEVRFYDILLPEQSKLINQNMLRSDHISFTYRLKEVLRENSKNPILRSSNSASEIESFLIENDYQIYWPYSENWDGEEIPVVTFALKEDGNSDEVYAYKIAFDSEGSSMIDSILVNEEYAEHHPVWIINNNMKRACKTYAKEHEHDASFL
jgi:hypothetical protein